MIFLIEYDRPAGRSIRIERFDDANRQQAQDAMLALELDLNRRGVRHEVVLLEAQSEAALRRTHGRYFETLEEMITNFRREVQDFVVRERRE